MFEFKEQDGKFFLTVNVGFAWKRLFTPKPHVESKLFLSSFE